MNDDQHLVIRDLRVAPIANRQREILQGINLEIDASRLVVQWASHSKQTVDRIEAALKAYRTLPAAPTAESVIRREWAIRT